MVIGDTMVDAMGNYVLTTMGSAMPTSART